jgi:hypothetical protein
MTLTSSLASILAPAANSTETISACFFSQPMCKEVHPSYRQLEAFNRPWDRHDLEPQEEHQLSRATTRFPVDLHHKHDGGESFSTTEHSKNIRRTLTPSLDARSSPSAKRCLTLSQFPERMASFISASLLIVGSINYENEIRSRLESS